MNSQDYPDDQFQKLICELAYESQKLVKGVSIPNDDRLVSTRNPRFLLESLKKRNIGLKMSIGDQNMVQNRIKSLGIDFTGMDTQIGALKDHVKPKKKDLGAQMPVFASDFCIERLENTPDFLKEYARGFKDYSLAVAINLNSNFIAANPNKSSLLAHVGKWDSMKERIYAQNKELKNEKLTNTKQKPRREQQRALQNFDRKQVLSKKHLSLQFPHSGTLDSFKIRHMDLLMVYMKQKELKGQHSALLHWIYEMIQMEKNEELKQIWKIIKFQYDGPHKPSSSFSEKNQHSFQQGNPQLNLIAEEKEMALVRRSCSFLEWEFSSLISQKSEHNFNTKLFKFLPHDVLVRIDFSLSHLSQFLSYINSKKRENRSEPLEYQADAFEVPVWGLLFILIRAGHVSDALAVLSVYNEETLEGVGLFKKYLRKWSKCLYPEVEEPKRNGNRFGMKNPESDEELSDDEDLELMREKSSSDIFHRALLIIMGLVPGTPSHLVEEQKTDFFWVTLKSIETDFVRAKAGLKKEWEQPIRSLEFLQEIMKEEALMNDGPKDSFVNTIQLFLSLLHWEGLQSMKKATSFRCQFVHLLIALYESQILATEANSEGPSQSVLFTRSPVSTKEDEISLRVPESIEVQIASEIYSYVKDFASLRPVEAMSYFQFFSVKTRAEAQANLMFECDLISLIFNSNSQEARTTKKQLVELIGDLNFRSICKKASEKFMGCPRYSFSDILLIEYTEDYEKILEKAMNAEARAISQLNNPNYILENGSSKLNEILVFEDELRKYMRTSQIIRKVETLKAAENYKKITDIKTIIQLFVVEKKPIEAFSKFCSSGIVPKNQGTWEVFSENFKRNAPEALKVAYLEVLIVLMKIIQESQESLTQNGLSNEGELGQLRNTRNAVVEFYEKHFMQIVEEIRNSETFGESIKAGIIKMKNEMK